MNCSFTGGVCEGHATGTADGHPGCQSAFLFDLALMSKAKLR